MKKYMDVADLPENNRIDLIGSTAMAQGKGVAFITDSDPGKKERYIKKLLTKFPCLEIEETCDGPVKGTVLVKVRRQKILGIEPFMETRSEENKP